MHQFVQLMAGCQTRKTSTSSALVVSSCKQKTQTAPSQEEMCVYPEIKLLKV